MNYEIIQALRGACTGFIVPQMEEDYIKLPEAERASSALLEEMKRRPELEELYALQADSESLCEEQGFVNGFRMGVRLILECTGTAPHTAQRTGTPGNVTPIVPPWAKEGA